MKRKVEIMNDMIIIKTRKFSIIYFFKLFLNQVDLFSHFDNLKKNKIINTFMNIVMSRKEKPG